MLPAVTAPDAWHHLPPLGTPNCSQLCTCLCLQAEDKEDQQHVRFAKDVIARHDKARMLPHRTLTFALSLCAPAWCWAKGARAAHRMPVIPVRNAQTWQMQKL